MVKIYVKNVILNLVKKRPKYASKWQVFPQNCKDFPPRAKFHRNEIHKFHIFAMHAHMNSPKS